VIFQFKHSQPHPAGVVELAAMRQGKNAPNSSCRFQHSCHLTGTINRSAGCQNENADRPAKGIAMIDRSDLIRKANDLRQQAELEANEQTRDTLIRLADYYAHLAESQAESEANPVDVASLGELLTKGR
jgi:hypothetical protein